MQAVNWPFLWEELQKLRRYERLPSDLDGACEYLSAVIGERCITGRAGRRLCELCRRGRSVDWLLRLTRKRYRDHYRHQWHVTALGLFLLHTRAGGGVPIWQPVADAIREQEGLDERPSCEAVEAAWIVAGALHDHAYPLAHILSAVRSCDDLGDARERQAALKGMSHVLDASEQTYHSELQRLADPESDYQTVLARLEELCRAYLVETWHVLRPDELALWAVEENGFLAHGLCAAVNVAITIRKAGANPRHLHTAEGRTQAACLRHACRAIALHDAPGNTEVHAGADPYAFILILCDEVQEWDRQVALAYHLRDEKCEVRIEGLGSCGDGAPALSDDVSLVYRYPDPAVLEETEWDLALWSRPKKVALDRLRSERGFGPHRFPFSVQVDQPALP